jgi:PEGA domain
LGLDLLERAVVKKTEWFIIYSAKSSRVRIDPVRRDFQITAFTALVAFFVSLLGSFCVASDLIAPTRTLQGGTEERGVLTVFSEPPQLEVFLDGNKAGETPLWLTEVKAGWHTVRIAEKETRFYLGPEKVLEVGLFKGSFITLPEKKEEHKKPQKVEHHAGTAPAKTRQPSEEQKKEELTRWELFVNGTLRHF